MGSSACLLLSVRGPPNCYPWVQRDIIEALAGVMDDGSGVRGCDEMESNEKETSS